MTQAIEDANEQAAANKAEDMMRAAFDRINAMTVADVSSVYSGKPGCCCNGNHRYNSQHVASASKNRGYAVDGSDINDRQVKKVLDIIKANAAQVATNYANDGGDSNNFFVNVTTDAGRERVYIVYPVKENS
jgi:hypothetical protein